MRHYDRAEYRHLDDAQRYRDHEYKADDGWVGPNEHAPEVPSERAAPRADTAGWRPPRVRRHARPTRSAVVRIVDAVLHPRHAARSAWRALIRALARRVARPQPDVT